MENNIQIIHEGNHYTVYVGGAFYCSADTYEDAVKELEEDGLL
jgi:hypothetical protein